MAINNTLSNIAKQIMEQIWRDTCSKLAIKKIAQIPLGLDL